MFRCFFNSFTVDLISKFSFKFLISIVIVPLKLKKFSNLHVGQRGIYLTALEIHSLQNVCPQGIVIGFVKKVKHKEHSNSY